MSIYKRFAKDIGIVAVSEIIVKFRPIIFLPIITAFLSVSDYGIYTTLLVTIAFLTPFSSLGARFGIIRLLSAESDKKKVSEGIFSVSFFTLALSLGLSAVMFFLAGFLADTVFGDPNSALIIQIGSLLVPLQALLDNSTAFFLMKQRMFICSIFNTLEAFLPIAFGTLVLLLGGGLAEFVLASVISTTAVVIASYVVIARWTGPSLPRLNRVWPYLKFGSPLVAGKFSSTLLNIGDRYVIGLLMGATYVGIYSVAYTIGSTVMMFLGPISTALLAPISKSYDGQRHDEVQRFMHHSIRYFLMFSIPAAVGLSILSPSLTQSLANSNFLEGAFGITALVAFASIFYGLFLLDSTIFYLIKHTYSTSALLIVASIANIAMNVLLIPPMGIFGSALATLISFIGLFFASYFFSRKRIKISFDLVFILKSTLAALMMGVLVYYLNPIGWVRILITSAIGAVVYFGLLFLMKGLTESEIMLFFTFLRKKLLKRGQTQGAIISEHGDKTKEQSNN